MTSRTSPSPWSILSLPEGTELALVKKRFRELAKVHHPDVGGDVRVFQQLQDAYQSILDNRQAPAVYRNVTLTLHDAFWGCDVEVSVGEVTHILPMERGITPRTYRYHDLGYGPGSDLYVEISVLEDSTWLRRGDDLATVLPVSSFLASIGGVMTVDRFGEDLEVVIPPTTQHGDLLRLPSMGMITDQGTGDVYLEIHLTTPTIPPGLYRDVEALLGKLSNFPTG